MERDPLIESVPSRSTPTGEPDRQDRFYGWRTSFLTLGILFGLVVVMATLVLSPVPRDLGVAGKGTEGRGLQASVSL
jgi:hypothetical protein